MRLKSLKKKNYCKKNNTKDYSKRFLLEEALFLFTQTDIPYFSYFNYNALPLRKRLIMGFKKVYNKQIKKHEKGKKSNNLA